jgi:hypothetical protein
MIVLIVFRARQTATEHEADYHEDTGKYHESAYYL